MSTGSDKLREAGRLAGHYAARVASDALELLLDTMDNMEIGSEDDIQLDAEARESFPALCAAFPPSTRFSRAFLLMTASRAVALSAVLEGKLRDLRPSCTADEMIAFYALGEAAVVFEPGVQRGYLEKVMELNFEDHDFEMLFDPSMDGVEEDEEITAKMGLANLSQKDWFSPFRDENICYEKDPHGPHDWLDGVIRDCPGRGLT